MESMSLMEVIVDASFAAGISGYGVCVLWGENAYWTSGVFSRSVQTASEAEFQAICFAERYATVTLPQTLGREATPITRLYSDCRAALARARSLSDTTKVWFPAHTNAGSRIGLAHTLCDFLAREAIRKETSR